MKNLMKVAGLTVAILTFSSSCSRPLFDSYLPTSVAPCVPKSYFETNEYNDNQIKPVVSDSIQTSKDRKFNEELNRIRGYSDPDGVKVNIPFMRF